MKTFKLTLILACLSLVMAIGFGVHKASAVAFIPTPYTAPAPQPDKHDTAHYQPFCGPAPTYIDKEFDRCAYESYYLKEPYAVALFNSGRWIWEQGHDGTPEPNITSAHGTGSSDMHGFVNVARRDLFGSRPNSGLLWMIGGTCPGVPDHTEYGLYLPGIYWCEVYAAALIGTAHYINTMLGMGGDDTAFNPGNLAAFHKYCPGQPNTSDQRFNGILVAQCRFDEWSSLIDYYVSQPNYASGTCITGWVNWCQSINFSDAADGVIGDNHSTWRLDTIVYRETAGYGLANQNTLDTGTYINDTVDIGNRYIVFHNPDGTVYQINKNCGNITGTATALQSSKNYRITASVPTPRLTDNAGSAETENPQWAEVPITLSVTNPPVGLATGTASEKIQVKRTFYVLRLGSSTHQPISPDINENRVFPGTGPYTWDDYPTSGFRISLTGLSGGPLVAGDRVCRSLYINPNSGTTDTTAFPIAGTGRSGTDGLVSAHGNPIDKTDVCATISNKPYVSFFHGDISAGGGFKTSSGSCTTINSGIKGLPKANNAGSGSQLAALGLGPVTAFASAYFRSAAGTDLTLANIGGPSLGNFGGTHCIPNYYGSSSGATSTTIAGDDLANAPASGAYTLTNNNLKGTLPEGKRIILYHNGDLNITSDITYQNSGGWSSVGHIPSLYLVVSGNIYVWGSTHRLDGVYIAQPNNPTLDTAANGGRIYTCTFGPSLVPTNQLLSLCNSQLKVYGAFIAQVVKFQRASGSQRFADPPGTANEYTSPSGAEVFYYTPETYLAGPVLPSNSSTATGVYQAISNLSPVL